MKIPVVYAYDERLRVWATSTPICPGAFGQGRTRASAKKDLASAIRDLVRLALDMGWPSPMENVKVKIEEIRV